MTEYKPIEKDKSFDRTYIPILGGWEIQTKGKGSSFRICNTKTDDRLPLCDSSFMMRHITEMAEESNAAWKKLLILTDSEISAINNILSISARFKDDPSELEIVTEHYPDLGSAYQKIIGYLNDSESAKS